MNDEKQMILEMLKEGKITVEEANNLLDAVGGKKIKSENDFISKLSQSIDSVIKKTTETINNIDFDNFDIKEFNIKGESNTHAEMRIDDEINKISIDIPNGKILIERAVDSAITLSQDIWSKKNDLIDYLDVDIDEDSLNITVNDKYNKVDASAVIKLSLAKNLYDDLEIDIVNGTVEISDVDFKDQTIDSVNAKITIINSSGNLSIDNVNGKIDIKNTNGELEIDNVNGAVYLSNISGEMASVDAVSGNIRVDGLNSKEFDADTTSGNIRIFGIKDTKNISLDSTSGNIIIDAEGYNGDIKAYVDGHYLDISDRFKNKIQNEDGFEVSTNINNTDLNINIDSSFGKVSLREQGLLILVIGL